MEVHLNKKLPKMAWFVELNHDGSPKYFEHGDSVVLTDEFAFEGTFSGEVSGQGIANSNVSLGSGFVQEEDGTLFITPSHTLEGLFIVRNQQRKFVQQIRMSSLTTWLASLLPTLPSKSDGG